MIDVQGERGIDLDSKCKGARYELAAFSNPDHAHPSHCSIAVVELPVKWKMLLTVFVQSNGCGSNAAVHNSRGRRVQPVLN